MIIKRAYRFRLQPTVQQVDLVNRFAGCRRWLWNEVLRLQRVRLDADLPVMGYAAMCKLAGWLRHNAETSWLAEAPSQTSQQALKDLRRAFDDFFDKSQPDKGFPRFKKRGDRDGFRYPQPSQITLDQANGRIRLPKLGWVRYRKSRAVEGQIRNVTVSRDGKHWFVSIQVEFEEEDPQHESSSEVGIDVGIARFATLSDGTVYEPISPFARRQRQLARLQRQLARKTKFSGNWKKQRARTQALHRKIRNARSDFLHYVSSQISENQAVVVMEDLRVRNMSRSAKGDVENPGKNVKAKSSLNRAILDQGWREFRRQIGYKIEWKGGLLILVDPRDTSRMCSCCKRVHEDNRVSQSLFRCVECGHTENADLNAAKNILAAGRAATACGGYPDVRGPMKQESPMAAEAA